MNLGFTGTRSGMSEDQWHWTKRVLRHYLMGFDLHTLHHGCCVGADAQVHTIAQTMSNDLLQIAIIGHPPTHTKWKAHLHGFAQERIPLPYLERNRGIVDECERLIACPLGPEIQGSGTWATIRYARKCGKPITIVWRDGTTTEER